MSFELLLRAAKWYCIGAHFPVRVTFLLWGWFRPPRADHLWARRLPSAYGGASASVANQFAAMPSLHVGWAAVIALVVLRTGPRPASLLAAGHAVTTLAVVVVTANHDWLDAIVAVALLAALAMALSALLRRSPAPAKARAVKVDSVSALLRPNRRGTASSA